jgi:hypothetical protein
MLNRFFLKKLPLEEALGMEDAQYVVHVRFIRIQEPVIKGLPPRNPLWGLLLASIGKDIITARERLNPASVLRHKKGDTR